MSTFGDKFEKSFISKPNYNDIEKVILEYDNKHIEFNTGNAEIEYRNVISPAEGGSNFPDRFFDKNHFLISDDDKQKCKQIIEMCLHHLPLENKMDLLPLGFGGNAYLRLIDKSDNNFYYSNIHTTNNGFQVTREKIEQSFSELFNFLKKYCDFPQIQIYKPADHTEKTVLLDDRYFNETLWECSKCNKGNLFEHKHCVFCGADRGW